MKSIAIESWAIGVLDRLSNSDPIEDRRVELKASWPDPVRAARRLAGHANAAHGDSILWLIGADENSGAIGASNNELADWFAQVSKQFDGLVPGLDDLCVPYNGQTVVALCFSTDRAPFVVRNPAFGQAKSGPVQLEVPWREGTAVRSATRQDLVRLLTPLEELPLIEILDGSIRGVGGQYEKEPFKGYDTSVRKNFVWQLRLDLYFVPKNAPEIVIPFHSCSATLSMRPLVVGLPMEQLRFNTWKRDPTTNVPASVNSVATQSELVLKGPGKTTFTGQFIQDNLTDDEPENVSVATRIRVAGGDRAIVLECGFNRTADFFFQLGTHEVSIN